MKAMISRARMNKLAPIVRRWDLDSVADEIRDDYFSGRLTKEQYCCEMKLLKEDLHKIKTAESN